MINFGKPLLKKIQTGFTTQSLLSGKLSSEYEFTGNKTVQVLTPITVDLTDYNRNASSNRYGTPTEMQDTVQELSLSQDKSFTFIIDKGNNEDQMLVKSSARMLGLQVKEKNIPAMDKYGFLQLARKAGFVISDSTAPSKSNICEKISSVTAQMDDEEVPDSGRSLFISAENYKFLRLSDEFMKVDKLAGKSLAQGVVGTYDNMDVVKVPKGRWPFYVNFMVVYKESAINPVKIHETKIHKDPPGISGALVEGRYYYDLFVFGAKCYGVAVSVNTSANHGTKVANPAITAATGAISCATTGATIVYTTDGTDPRYSATKKTGTQSDVTTAGTVVKAYAYKDTDGVYPSDVVSTTLT